MRTKLSVIGDSLPSFAHESEKTKIDSFTFLQQALQIFSWMLPRRYQENLNFTWIISWVKLGRALALIFLLQSCSNLAPILLSRPRILDCEQEILVRARYLA